MVTNEESNLRIRTEPDDAEATSTSENSNNVASEKGFKLKHVFKNANKFENGVFSFSEREDYFNVKWSMAVKRKNKYLDFYAGCEPIVPTDEWSIQTITEIRVVGRNQDGVTKTGKICYKNIKGRRYYSFLGWEEMKEEYLVDGNLTVEAKVTIIETIGLEKPKIRMFDVSQKDVSDVILVVRGTKFYVSKMFLASQSTVFKALLFGNFSESKHSEVKLNGIDPDGFHYFLEVLHGESAIDESNVGGIALLADMYDAPTAIRRCEEFLLEKSKKTLEKKLEIATRYNLKNVEEYCMSGIAGDQAGVRKQDDHQTEVDFTKMLACVALICFFGHFLFSVGLPKIRNFL